MLQRLAEFVIKNRILLMIVIGLFTIFFGYYCTKVNVRTSFEDLLPKRHDYVKVYNEYKKQFGGANLIFICYETKSGDIFSHKSLSQIRKITTELDLIPAVDHNQVNSITHLSSRDIRVQETGAIKAVPLVPYPIPESADGLADIKKRTYNNATLIGDLVSFDGKSALIRAAFIEKSLDYETIFSRVQKLRKEITDENPDATLYVAGDPMLKGWVFFNIDYINFIFFLTGAGLVGLLVIYFRRIMGCLLPLTGALVGAIWGIGCAGMLGYDLDPLMLVVPFLLSARALSHGVQMTERFYEEYEVNKEKVVSAQKAFYDLCVPATLSCLCDAFGIIVVATASFPMLVKLGIYCCLWSFALIPTVVVLIPCLLATVPAPRKAEHYIPKSVHWVLDKIVVMVDRHAKGIVIGSVVLTLVAFYCCTPWGPGGALVVGTDEVGSTLVFPDSDFNVSSRVINDRFYGTNSYQLYLGADKYYGIYDNGPALLEWTKKYTEYLLSEPTVGGTRDLEVLVANLNQMFQFDEPKFGLIPETKEVLTNWLFCYTASAPATGILNPWMDLEAQNMAITVFVKDLKAKTLADIDRKTRKFIAENKLPAGVNAKMAGGIVGLVTATNQEIERSNWLGTVLVLVVIFLLIAAFYRSIVAGLLLFSTLGLAMLVTTAYMSLVHIGLDVDTLPIICLGVGVGIDYAVYIFDRVEQEFKIHQDLNKATDIALKTTGMAVTFTATTLVGGVVFWIFFSPLRFHSDMALLISILMLLCMVTALVMLPAILRVFRPKVLSTQIH